MGGPPSLRNGNYCRPFLRFPLFIAGTNARAYRYVVANCARLVWLTLLFAINSSAAQTNAWQCTDERMKLTLWSADVVRGTQMLWARDGSLWVIELRGRLLKLVETERGVRASEVFSLGALAHSADPEMGATSLAFGPDFDGTTGTIYLAHNWDEADGRRVGGISRVVLSQAGAPQANLILGPIPSAGAHQVDRLILDDKGELLVSVGDVWQPRLAQADDNPAGKVLRLRPNVATVNEADHHVEAKGLRSPFAFGRRLSDGLIVIGNNGPEGDDALYVLKTGANFGWGAASGAKHDPPLYLWHRTVSPDDVCFYEASAEAPHRWPKEYDGNLFVALFHQIPAATRDDPLQLGRQVLRFRLSGEGSAVRVEGVEVLITHKMRSSECPLDLAVSPEGDLFLMTFDVDPHASGASMIYRVRARATKQCEGDATTGRRR